MSNKSGFAFTLIELLVVVAVVGVLAGLLLPALNAARAMAKRAQCVSNLRQIGLAITMYADEHQGLMPGTTHGSVESNSWVYTLQPYIAHVDRIRVCPADPKAARRQALKLTSYVLNEYTSVPKYDNFGGVIEAQTFVNLYRLKSPSQTITVFEGADHLGLAVTADHTHSRSWSNLWTQVRNDIQPDRHRVQAPTPQRDRGTANYLFADGHVETLDAAKLRKQFEAGVNIAQPPN